MADYLPAPPLKSTTHPAKPPVSPLRPPDGFDLRAKVLDLIPYLRPHERVTNVEHPRRPTPLKSATALEALELLTGADSGRQIGVAGPPAAAYTPRADVGTATLSLFRHALFGRDALRVSLDLLDRYPKLAAATIIELASLQGIQANPRSGEERGRIVHESRDPESQFARDWSLVRGWEWPYYESIDATPLFITAVKRYCKQEGDAMLDRTYLGRDGVRRTIGEAFDRSVDWLVHRLGQNPDGFLEFHRRMSDDSETWRDSFDAFSHADGELANHRHGVASLEVQALAHDALLDAIYDHGRPNAERSAELLTLADNLRQRINATFWVDDRKHGGYFAIGTDRADDGGLRQLKIRTSDMGHLLNSRLLDGNDPITSGRRQQTIRQLFSPDLLAVSGVRTLAEGSARFRPGGYHTGSVWLWDTYYIAQGLERQGYYGLSLELKSRIWQVCDVTTTFPEFARGDDSSISKLNRRVVDIWEEETLRYQWNPAQSKIVAERGGANRIEQPPQEIQAWTVAAILESKSKRDPLHPTKPIPTAAIDPAKRAFEAEILASLPVRVARLPSHNQ